MDLMTEMEMDARQSGFFDLANSYRERRASAGSYCLGDGSRVAEDIVRRDGSLALLDPEDVARINRGRELDEAPRFAESPLGDA